ncbi:methyltransferase domain-containing protein [Aquiflexum sp. TKW24L]|uniref:tRNA1(Val) (adenine(37)-N6)-methyltransferase n=1 Tax=Aquiflexum sp. TKW24L TaxID=2942212 RepID=UPI0020BF556E|nr:methyltransferase domain-containing protein [Aquiflexum sp. TKW24L]MCL6257793.1 methyltransferase domain-containing protein [Aquiflexum sp. TKW24L]
MTSTPFRFKQFDIHHDRTAMKVGTDGVLLGAIAGIGNPQSILEIGVGSGVVSLMLAQRFPQAKITGVEIDSEAWKQATENAENSPWSERIEFVNMSFQEYCGLTSQKFDLIVSNPPYFPNHLKSIDPQRNLALHNDALPFTEMASGISGLLNLESEIWVILPPSQMAEFERILDSLGLKFFNKVNVKDKPSKNILRMIYGFSFYNHSISEKDLSIKMENGNFSDEYSELLRNFLTIF